MRSNAGAMCASNRHERADEFVVNHISGLSDFHAPAVLGPDPNKRWVHNNLLNTGSYRILLLRREYAEHRSDYGCVGPIGIFDLRRPSPVRMGGVGEVPEPRGDRDR